jgi:hypothetical protein
MDAPHTEARASWALNIILVIVVVATVAAICGTLDIMTGYIYP